MEHLGSNLIDARHGLNKVRLFAELQPALERSFHTLHTGALGWIVGDDGLCQPSEGNLQIGSGDNGRSNGPSTKFVQRWLWFEVLRGILGHLEGFDLRHFVKENPGENQLITTSKLPDYLRRWQESETQQPVVRRHLQAHLILEQAQFFVSRYCAVGIDRENPDWSIDPNVALSIMVLGETLTTALVRIQKAIKFDAPGWHSRNLSTQGWGYSSAVLAIMKNENVCPNKIHMLKGLFQKSTVGLLYALQLLPRGIPGEFHDSCDARRCRPVQCYLPGAPGNPSNTPRVRGDPEPIHCRGCRREGCKQIGPDTKELSRIIRESKIPLLQYNKDSATVTLVEMSKSIDKEYVVFSHVWADGYGNRKANVLNQCVLDLFMQLFRQIKYSKTQTSPIAPENFWIDTLAIPVQAEYNDQRKSAIRSMYRIYTGAKYTIVLDAGLMSVSRGEGYAQPAMSISVSRWMTRLWTWQEAVLSKELHFNFSDEIVSMDHLEALYEEESASLNSTVTLASHKYSHGIMKNERKNKSRAILGPDSTPEDRKLKPGFVAAAWKALQWRTTTHLEHETLALATLLDLETDDFADRADDSQIHRRMMKLLDLLAARQPCLIPPGIIFLPGPRISEKGYRWAPQTWLSSCPAEQSDALTLECPMARLIPNCGLDVVFPGFLLDRPSKTQGLFSEDNEFYFPTSLSLRQWYRIRRADEEAENTYNRDLAIIAPQLPLRNPEEIALLVAVDRKHVFYVEILHRIWINEVSNSEEIKTLRNKFLTASHKSWSWGEILSDGQHWCVDGIEAAQLSTENDDDDKNSKTSRWDWIRSARKSKTWR